MLSGVILVGSPSAQTDRERTPPATVSASGLFTAATPETGLNSLLTSYAEGFLSVFEKKFPGIRSSITLIRFEITPGSPAVWKRQAFVFNGRLCFQLNMGGPLPLDGAELDYQLAQIFFLLMANGNRTFAGGEKLILPPDWLAQGYVLWTLPSAEPILAETLKPDFESQKWQSLGHVMKMTHPSKPGREEERFHAYSWLLFRALVAQQEMPASLSKAFDYMRQGVAAEDAFITAFPEINKPAVEREKWWLLQASRYYDLLQQEIPTFVETDRKIESLIHFHDPADNKSYTLLELESFHSSASCQPALESARNRMRILRGTAPAPYRRVIDEYLDILDNALKTKPEWPPSARVRGLEELRRDILEHEKSIADYLNWYLITQVPARRAATQRLIKSYENIREHRMEGVVRQYLNTVRTPSGVPREPADVSL